MTCRAACGSMPEGAGMARVACADCGATGLSVYYTSQDGQTHLCPGCFEARLRLGTATQGRTEG